MFRKTVSSKIMVSNYLNGRHHMCNSTICTTAPLHMCNGTMCNGTICVLLETISQLCCCIAIKRHHMYNGTICVMAPYVHHSFHIDFAQEECLFRLLVSTLCCQIWVDNWFLILSQYPATNKLFPLNMNTYANELLHIFRTQG